VTISPLGGPAADNGTWVEAAPFRAHLRHLMWLSGLSASTTAVLAGISPGLAHLLLHGRRGRPLRRINPDSARKLLRVTAADARAVRLRNVPAQATAHHLRRLVGAGWSDGELAELLRLPPARVRSLIIDGSGSCTQLTALQAAAEVSLLLRPLPQRYLDRRAAA
jgi:hypothetical protein